MQMTKITSVCTSNRPDLAAAHHFAVSSVQSIKVAVEALNFRSIGGGVIDNQRITPARTRIARKRN